MAPSRTVHPTDATLRAFGLGELDAPSAESVNKHLEDCGSCRRLIAEISPDRGRGPAYDAPGQHGPGSHVVSSLAGLSMLDTISTTPARPAAAALPPGLADHPDYEIIRELGQGGMGTVFLALNRLMGRHEVLKVVSGHLMNKSSVADRFLGEIRNAARLHHTNIVTAYSAMRLGESIVFAMEFVDGLDLAKLVKARGALPVANACNYIHQAALGLQHAQERGMVHRDIKPSNLMLAKRGNRAVIKVLDFGLAKLRSERPVDGGLTHEGQMLGTPDFIAPEQISDARRADTRADIYSLGCTLYYLLTGGPPFRAKSLYEILEAHRSKDALPINLVRSDVPVELAALVARMMAKQPERRFQEPRDVARALAPFFKTGTNAAAGAESVAAARALSTPDGEERPAAAAAAVGPMPTKPVTGAGLPSDVAGPAASDAQWQSLINIEKTEGLRQAPPAVAPSRRRWPPSWPLVIAAGVVGLIGIGVIVAVSNRYGGGDRGIVSDQAPLVAKLDSPSRDEPAPTTPPEDEPAPTRVEPARLKVETAKKASPGVPEDASMFEGKHYQVIDKQMTWHEARAECERMGGHLVIIKNEKENQFVASLLLTSGVTAAWLGATDERIEGQWIWVDGTEMQFNAWDLDWGQPDNRSSEDWTPEHYVIMVVSRQGAWLDQPVQGEQKWHPGFVCQW